MLTAPSASARGRDAESPNARYRRSLGWRASEAFVTLAAAFAIFTDTIAYDLVSSVLRPGLEGLVIPFLPQLFTQRLGTPQDQVEKWTALTLEAFGLTQLLFTCIAGYVVDRSVSKSAPMIAGLVILFLATFIFFLGRTEEMIILARGVQGASSGLVWVSAMAFLVSQVDDENIGIYMGYTTLGLTIGELVGPLLGGSLYDTAGHWYVFGVMVVILLANLSIRSLVREIRKAPAGESKSREHVSDTDPLLGARRAADDEDETYFSTSDASGSSVTDAGHEAVESLRTLGRNCISSVLGLVVVSTVRFGFEAVIPLFVFRQFGWSSGSIGAVMSCFLMPNVAGPVLGKYTSLYGPRWFSSVALFTCGVFLMTLCLLTGNHHHANSNDSAPSSAPSALATQVLFILNVTAIGIGIAVTTITHGTALSVSSPRAEDLAARARAGGATLNWALRLVTPGTMMSGLSTSWAVAIFLGPASANFFHFGTDEGFVRLCIFWSVLCMATGLYSMFAWRKW